MHTALDWPTWSPVQTCITSHDICGSGRCTDNLAAHNTPGNRRNCSATSSNMLRRLPTVISLCSGPPPTFCGADQDLLVCQATCGALDDLAVFSLELFHGYPRARGLEDRLQCITSFHAKLETTLVLKVSRHLVPFFAAAVWVCVMQCLLLR